MIFTLTQKQAQLLGDAMRAQIGHVKALAELDQQYNSQPRPDEVTA